jgi:hypothetical protein
MRQVCIGWLFNVYDDSTNLLELARGFRWQPTEYVNGRSRFNSRKLLNQTDEVDHRAIRLTPRRAAKWFPPHTPAEGFRLRGRAENELHYDSLVSSSGSFATFTAMRRASSYGRLDEVFSRFCAFPFM